MSLIELFKKKTVAQAPEDKPISYVGSNSDVAKLSKDKKSKEKEKEIVKKSVEKLPENQIAFDIEGLSPEKKETKRKTTKVASVENKEQSIEKPVKTRKTAVATKTKEENITNVEPAKKTRTKNETVNELKLKVAEEIKKPTTKKARKEINEGVGAEDLASLIASKKEELQMGKA